MEINGWNYLFENLPYWDIRDRFPYVYDQLIQSPSGEYAVLIYSIAEVNMCNEVGCLAVLKRRKLPFLTLNAYQVHFPPQAPIFSVDSRYVFLKSQMYLPAQNRVGCPLLLLDMYVLQFTVLAVDTYRYCFAIQNQTENELSLCLTPCFDSSGPQQQFSIQIADLRWHSFCEINVLESWLEK